MDDQECWRPIQQLVSVRQSDRKWLQYNDMKCSQFSGSNLSVVCFVWTAVSACFRVVVLLILFQCVVLIVFVLYC